MGSQCTCCHVTQFYSHFTNTISWTDFHANLYTVCFSTEAAVLLGFFVAWKVGVGGECWVVGDPPVKTICS